MIPIPKFFFFCRFVFRKTIHSRQIPVLRSPVQARHCQYVLSILMPPQHQMMIFHIFLLYKWTGRIHTLFFAQKRNILRNDLNAFRNLTVCKWYHMRIMKLKLFPATAQAVFFWLVALPVLRFKFLLLFCLFLSVSFRLCFRFCLILFLFRKMFCCQLPAVHRAFIPYSKEQASWLLFFTFCLYPYAADLCKRISLLLKNIF